MTDHHTPPPAAATDPVDRLKAEAEATTEAVEAAKQRLGEAVDLRRGGPADSVADARSKLADLRLGVERDLAALRARAPEPEAIRRRGAMLGAAVGGGLATLAILATALGRRRAHRAHQEEVAEQALAIARAIARLDTVDLTVQPADDEEGGGGRAALAGLGIAAIGAGIAAWIRTRPAPEELDVWGPPQG